MSVLEGKADFPVARPGLPSLPRTGHAVGAGLLGWIGSRPSSIAAEVGFPLAKGLTAAGVGLTSTAIRGFLELARSDFIREFVQYAQARGRIVPCRSALP